MIMQTVVYLFFILGMMRIYHLLVLKKKTFLFGAYLVFPGTFLHEGSHWFMAKALNGKPTNFSVKPIRGRGGWWLGKINYDGYPYNKFFIQLAPMILLGPICYWLVAWRLEQPRDWSEILYLLGISNLCYGAMPSMIDIESSLSEPPDWVWAGITLLYFYAVL